MTICEEVKKGYETAKRDGIDFEVSEPRAFYSSESIDDFPKGNHPGYIDLFRAQSKGLTGEERGREYSKAEAFIDYANQLCDAVSQDVKFDELEVFAKRYLQIVEAAMVHLTLAGYPKCTNVIGMTGDNDPINKINRGFQDFARKVNFKCSEYAINLVFDVMSLERSYKL